ncbi:MAG: ABC transporter permease [Verrucomicrobiae bacterium]|nr:ABC transporter permease [Verrucomicrobiae bacterium]
MRVIATLMRRELGGFFYSMSGYVLIAGALLLLGFSFTLMVDLLNSEPAEAPITELFYKTQFFWLIVLIVSPLITMRTFAQERSSGTYETLMTAPVSDVQVVLAKYGAALLFFLLLWLPFLAYPWILHRYAPQPELINTGAQLSTATGILLFGMLYTAVGVFGSALTRSQITAAMVSLAIGVALFLASFLHVIQPVRGGWQTTFYRHISMVEHMQDFCRGVVDSRAVAYYAGLTLFFLFLTLKVVESRRWK